MIKETVWVFSFISSRARLTEEHTDPNSINDVHSTATVRIASHEDPHIKVLSISLDIPPSSVTKEKLFIHAMPILIQVIEMGDVEMKNEPKLDSELLVKAVVRLMKRAIFEEFIKTGELSADDQEFCDRIDWYPVDELPLRDEYVKKLKRIEKGPHSKAMTLEELDKWFDEL